MSWVPAAGLGVAVFVEAITARAMGMDFSLVASPFVTLALGRKKQADSSLNLTGSVVLP